MTDKVALREGIIPAHAGLTVAPRMRIDNTRDHPRACGAHHHGCAVAGTDAGIIPAHAGLTR